MPPGATAGGIAVVIDVLRASTTMTTALSHGAVAVFPRQSIEEVRGLAASHAGAILGGERGCLPIDGFHFGNSPLEYTAERVAGRVVIITTTNGTAALAACHDAEAVLVGAMVNRTAVATAARRLAIDRACQTIHLVCAGTDGEVTEEDILTAGAILDAAGHDEAAATDTLDPSALAAQDQFRQLVNGKPDESAARIVEVFKRSRGGKNLVSLGMDGDITAAAAIDELAVVAHLEPMSNRLVLLSTM